MPAAGHPTNHSITIGRENKIFKDKTKFTKYLCANPALQKVINVKIENLWTQGNGTTMCSMTNGSGKK